MATDNTLDISLKNIKKKYKRGKRDNVVLDNVSLDIPYGKFVVISGDSGAGKSTLLNIASGLSKPSSGSVFYGNKDITKLTDEELSAFRNNHLGIVTQESDLISYLTLLENLKISCIINKVPDDESFDRDELFSLITDELGLSALKDELPCNMSGGEIKRAAIARALVTKPKVIIMDEPTANLDRGNVRSVLKLLRKFCDLGSTVIISSHESEAIDFADINLKLDYTELGA